MGGSRRSAWQGVGAKMGTNVRQQNFAPWEQSFLALLKSIEDRSPERIPRSANNQIPIRTDGGTKSAVYDRSISV